MKILFLVSRVPYALDKGDKLRAFHQLRILARKHEIVLFALTDSPVPPEAKPALEAYCSEVVIHQIPKKRAVASMVMGLPKGLPLQVAYFYDPDAQHQLDLLIQKHQPDHIYCQLIRMASYALKYTHIPKTLDYMDAFSKGIERRLKITPLFLRPAFLLEYKRLLNYEKEVFDHFNNQTIISEQDRYFIQHPHKYNILVVPNGVDKRFFQVEPGPKQYEILFAGNMGYVPNMEAARYLVKKIMPLVWGRFPQTKVLIAGKDPGSKVKALAGKNVTVSGTMPDIREAYNQAQMLVAPLFLGTGLQNKVLEAMAVGLPCVTTTMVNNAIGGKKGEQILLADNPEAYATHILFLLQNPIDAKRIGLNAQNMVKAQYTWKRTTARLEALINPTL